MLSVFISASWPSLAVWLHNHLVRFTLQKKKKKEDVDTQRHKPLILCLNCLIYINMWNYCSSCSPFEGRKEGKKENIAVQSSGRAVRVWSDSCAAARRLWFIPDDGSVAVHDFHWSWQDSLYIRWAELNSVEYMSKTNPPRAPKDSQFTPQTEEHLDSFAPLSLLLLLSLRFIDASSSVWCWVSVGTCWKASLHVLGLGRRHDYQWDTSV